MDNKIVSSKKKIAARSREMSQKMKYKLVNSENKFEIRRLNNDQITENQKQ